MGFLLCVGVCRAQLDSDFDADTSQQYTDLNARAGERFDIVFGRSFLVTGSAPDSAPIRNQSGSVFIGFSYNLLVGKRLSFRAVPGVNFFRAVYGQTDAKTFPSPAADTTVIEKLRNTYLELPVGVGLALGRDEKGRLRTLIEGGLSAGVRLASTYRGRVDLPGGNSQSVKLDQLTGFESFRATAWGRFTYRFLGLWVVYRLTDFFNSEPVGSGFTLSGSPGPEPGRLEIGLNLVL